MINEKNIFLTVSWLSGLLSAEIFISTGEWGVQMPPLTAENSHLLWSGSQGATLVMKPVFHYCMDRFSLDWQINIPIFWAPHPMQVKSYACLETI